jgi:hypothetical protein
MGVLTWCFCGVVVVFCVVNVVIKPSCFVVIKNVTRILNLFPLFGNEGWFEGVTAAAVWALE